MAVVTYEMEYKSTTLLSDKQRADGLQAWTLCRVVKTARGKWVSSEDVAIFNFDTEGVMFQRFIADGGKVKVHEDIAELIRIEQDR